MNRLVLAAFLCLLMVWTISGRPPDEIIGKALIWHSDSQYVWADSCECDSCYWGMKLLIIQ